MKIIFLNIKGKEIFQHSIPFKAKNQFENGLANFIIILHSHTQASTHYIYFHLQIELNPETRFINL